MAARRTKDGDNNELEYERGYCRVAFESLLTLYHCFVGAQGYPYTVQSLDKCRQSIESGQNFAGIER
jgi:hypothetical protein